MDIVIVGGVAAGPKIASRINRVAPGKHRVVMIEKGKILSYGGCGLPFWLSGEIADEVKLYSTTSGAVRNEEFFRKVKGFEARSETEVMAIDRAAKRVTVRHVPTGAEEQLRYDKLVFATGSTPIVPPLPGARGRTNVFTVKHVEDIRAIKATIPDGAHVRATIVGGGLIGVEMLEAFTRQGHTVTLIEMLPNILSMCDGHVSALVENHIRAKGVALLTGTRVEALEGDGDAVSAVRTDHGTIDTDLVVFAIGTRPATALARDIGLELTERGAIVVNDQQQTSDPDIYAAGDCCMTIDRVTGAPCWVPLGSTANKQGRVVANAITGHPDSFPGVVGATICRVFDMNIGKVGLTEARAAALGLDAVSIMCAGPDRAHFHPSMKPLALKITVEKGSRRVLGLQAVGLGDAAKRLDVASIALSAGWTVDQLAQADLCYAPPFSSAMDNLITISNAARNLLDEMYVSVMPDAGRELLQRPDIQLIDVRTPHEYVSPLGRLKGSKLIPIGTLRTRHTELSKERDIVIYCKSSLRGFEAVRILMGVGFAKERLIVLAGGMLCWPYERESGPVE
eukprot:gnl/Chilomastix_cuspidata/325.p2 GENE.gnl/Chilomastix_cuspidata/325~~gnl/Chilomastix_cuspidata/325.p2  ORF type:complete len:567 (-),score=270.49 gnl/Chilomastix_cuspidata/325:75-1775(-)